jgi:hypothetical protein
MSLPYENVQRLSLHVASGDEIPLVVTGRWEGDRWLVGVFTGTRNTEGRWVVLGEGGQFSQVGSIRVASGSHEVVIATTLRWLQDHSNLRVVSTSDLPTNQNDTPLAVEVIVRGM